MPNGPPNPWSESNSPSLRQNQGGSIPVACQLFGGVLAPLAQKLQHCLRTLHRRPSGLLRKFW
ncbi:Uncharacterised protein [Mycobacteroides abscessus subsp. abscessus]|nr:Uncharacterised protein [Mycobacteroides abscessus subsp. abscessus]